MPMTPVNLPDGTQANINHPEGATDDQILQYAKQQYDAGTFGQSAQLTAQPQPEATVGDYGRAFGQGVSFGFGDEIEAYTRSLFGDSSYEEELGQIRGEMKQFEQDNEYAALGTEIIGSLATPGGFLKLPKLLSRFKKAQKASTLGNIGKATAGGVAAGGAYGVGKSEGEIGSDQAMSDAVEGAAMGGIFGAGGQAAVQLGSFLTRTGKALANRAANETTVESVQAAMRRAYQEFGKVAEVADANIILPNMYQSAKKIAEKNGYRYNINPVTSDALDMLDDIVKKGESYNVSQLDELRSRLFQKANQASSHDANIVRGIAHNVGDYVDDLIARSPNVSDDAATAARNLYKQFSKMRMMDDAFKVASHGNAPTHVAYKSAVQSILRSPSKLRYFSEPEVAAMHEFVKGGLTQRAAEYMARYSPGSNSLASLLQLTHIAINPKMAGLTAAAGVSQVGADLATSKAAKELTEFMGGGKPLQEVSAPVLRAAPLGVAGSEYYSE